MGCGSSNVQSQVLEEKPELTNQQKETLIQTWKNLHADLERIGMLMFMGLFEHNPEIKEFFFGSSNMKTEELRYNEKLQEHGIRVMGLVEKIVACMDAGEEKMDQMILDLGKRHVGYDVHVPFIDLFGKQFVYAIKPALHTHWTPNVEEAWTQLFKYIGYLMRTGYRMKLKQVVQAKTT
ncbi:neuroglobin-1-like [Ptychodera flava]|uniref:neuroglobin-1-like n=1 Tax=Ptychodera flava TaxID=63121 RepID=UPI00396A210E